MLAPITHVLGARPNFVKAAPVIRGLAALGHRHRVVHTGQHYDKRLSNVERFDSEAARTSLGLPERYVVATLHRPSNVDDPVIAAGLVRALHEIAAVIDVVIPVHPRGRVVLEEAGLSSHPGIHAVEPLGYLEFMALVRGAAAVATDSGGVQEETT